MNMLRAIARILRRCSRSETRARRDRVDAILRAIKERHEYARLTSGKYGD